MTAEMLRKCDDSHLLFLVSEPPRSDPGSSLFGSATQSRGGIGQYELHTMGKGVGGQGAGGTEKMMGSDEPRELRSEGPGDRRFHLALIG